MPRTFHISPYKKDCGCPSPTTSMEEGPEVPSGAGRAEQQVYFRNRRRFEQLSEKDDDVL